MMGKVTGFLKTDRHDRVYEKPERRLKNYKEFIKPLPPEELNGQAARCMDCGIPFCHNACPVNNQIPDWNNLVYREQWEQASINLHSTNNFPEFTGCVCPAPCEAACTSTTTRGPSSPSSAPLSIVPGRKAGSHCPRRR